MAWLGFVVREKPEDGKERDISGYFQIRSSAEQYLELAKKEHPKSTFFITEKTRKSANEQS